MMLLGHLMLIPGPLVMLSSAPDLRKMLPSHLEVLTSPLTHLAALTCTPFMLKLVTGQPRTPCRLRSGLQMCPRLRSDLQMCPRLRW